MNVESQEVLAKGVCERVGSAGSFHKYALNEGYGFLDCEIPDHDSAMHLVLDHLCSDSGHVIDSLDEIDAVGHRVVQGGKYFSHSVLIDDDVIDKIHRLEAIAPLHNKAALMGIKACQHYMPDTPMVAVFDTSFFQTLPPRSYMYPLPYRLYEDYSIRKYGAHGTSHRFVAERTCEVLDERIGDMKLITCHLGNGSSVAAIDHGVAIDTSMGMTPLDGLMMGTRCGSIDPAIVTYVMRKENLTPDEMDDLMNRESGLLGISGISNDLRHVLEASEKGNKRAMLAYDMYSYSVKKYIGQYFALMGGVDAIALSGGVGENDVKMRRMIFAGLQSIGIVLDEKRNKEGPPEREISTDTSRVRIFIVPTNEEYMIARDTYDIVHEHIGWGDGVFVEYNPIFSIV
jgi:acetate kinase